MPWEDDVSAFADKEILLNFDARLAKRVDFLQDSGGIDHDAACDDGLHVAAKNAARNERKLVLLAVENNGMTCVRTALIAHDNVVLRRQKIDDLTLRFVSPLQTNYASSGHVNTFRKCNRLFARIQTLK